MCMALFKGYCIRWVAHHTECVLHTKCVVVVGDVVVEFRKQESWDFALISSSVTCVAPSQFRIKRVPKELVAES